MKRFSRLVFSMLCSLAVLTSIFPIIENVANSLFSETFTIKVTSIGNGGGSEVWIADNSFYNLSTSLENNTIIGSCEFRKKEDYGYGYDFLISFGNNIGTEIRIPYYASWKPKVMFYLHNNAGKITIQSGDQIDTINLYSETPRMLEYDLHGHVEFIFLLILLYGVLFSIISSIVYHCSKKIRFEKREAEKKRDSSLDLIRTVAVFFVLFVHSFISSGYYEMNLGWNTTSVVLTFFRWIAACCNALFLLLTGYLCRDRLPNRKAYKALLNPLLTYLVATIIRIVVFDLLVWKQESSIKNATENLFSLNYSWYLQMYLGLGLFIPLINLAIKNITTEKRIAVLVGLMVIVTGSGITGGILPNYWVCLFPFMYYLIGGLIADYSGRRIKTRFFLLGFLASIALETIYTITKTNNGKFDWMMLGGGNSHTHTFLMMVSSVLLFVLLKRIRIKNVLLTRVFLSISQNAFAIYIISVEITDNLVYPVFKNLYPTAEAFMHIQLIPVCISFVIAWALSLLIAFPIKQISRRVNRLFDQFI